MSRGAADGDEALVLGAESDGLVDCWPLLAERDPLLRPGIGSAHKGGRPSAQMVPLLRLMAGQVEHERGLLDKQMGIYQILDPGIRIPLGKSGDHLGELIKPGAAFIDVGDANEEGFPLATPRLQELAGPAIFFRGLIVGGSTLLLLKLILDVCGGRWVDHGGIAGRGFGSAGFLHGKSRGDGA